MNEPSESEKLKAAQHEIECLRNNVASLSRDLDAANAKSVTLGGLLGTVRIYLHLLKSAATGAIAEGDASHTLACSRSVMADLWQTLESAHLVDQQPQSPQQTMH